jgi:hypothetical protein
MAAICDFSLLFSVRSLPYGLLGASNLKTTIKRVVSFSSHLLHAKERQQHLPQISPHEVKWETAEEMPPLAVRSIIARNKRRVEDRKRIGVSSERIGVLDRKKESR